MTGEAQATVKTLRPMWGIKCPGALSALGAAILLTMGVGPAAAVSISTAGIELSLVIADISGGDPSGLAISGGVGLFDEGTVVQGGGRAKKRSDLSVSGDPSALGVGDGIFFDAGARSSAVGPAGLADTFSFNDGFITVNNASMSPLDVDFLLSYDLAGTASVNAPDMEAGFARAAGSLRSSLGVMLDLVAEADSILGPLSKTVVSTLPFTRRFGPMQSDTFHVTADAEASSASLAPIPLPPALPMLAAAVASLAAVALRRRPRFGWNMR